MNSNVLKIIGAIIPAIYTKGKSLFATVEIKINGVLQPLSGWSFRYVVKCPGCNVIVEATLDNNMLSVIGTGLVRIDIDPSELDGLPIGKKGCTHGFEAIDPDGRIWPIFEGEMEVLKDPTAV